MIKAIETVYNGYRFRSRLEARWAVFFDALGIEYEYEPEGYEYFDAYGNQMRWLPDFRLNSEAGLLVEVKGSDESLQNDLPRLASAVERGNTPASEGLVILGDIPNPNDIGFGRIPVFSYLERHLPYESDVANFLGAGIPDFDLETWEWTLVDYAAFLPFREEMPTSAYRYEPLHYKGTSSHVVRGLANIRAKVFKIGDNDGVLYSRVALSHGMGLEIDEDFYRHGLTDVSTKTRITHLWSYELDKLKTAYKMARQARFEHGETPKVGKVI